MTRLAAAVFFSTYDTLKRVSPLENAAVTHMLSASIAEVVRASMLFDSHSEAIYESPDLIGSLSDSSAD